VNRPQTYLHHILDCIEAVQEYIGDDRDAFLHNRMAQDAVLRQLQIMAESSQRLPDDLKAGYPDVEWRALAAFRNVLVHNYLGVDVGEALTAFEAKMPVLRAAAEAMLADFGDKCAGRIQP
jgi:uncharacterized protein with HEPN domain